MTLSTLTSRVSYPGAGSAGPFAIPFRFLSTADLLVTKRAAAGTETTLALTTHYTVTGANEATGNLTLVTALAAGETLVIRRKPALEQPTSIRNQGAYYPATIEDEFDRLAMQVQSLQDGLDRSTKLKESVPGGASLTELDPETGKVVAGTGTGFTMSTLDSSAVALPGGGRTVATLSAYLANNAVFNANDFGAVANGTDKRAQIQAAIDAALAIGGGVYLPDSGDYGIGTIAGTLDSYANGLVVNSYTEPGSSPQKRVRITGASRSTRLKGLADNMVIVRFSAEKCELSNLTIDGDNRTGILGLGIMGPNSASTTNTDGQTHNHFRSLYVRQCATGTLLKASGAGLVAYNKFEFCNWTGNLLRAVYLTDANSTTAPRTNRNIFVGCTANGPGNTGVEVARGDTNRFIAFDIEDITSGATPNAVPTAFVILAGDADQNTHNTLVACMVEGCTRDLNNANRRTKVFGGVMDAAKIAGLGTPGIDALVGVGDIDSRLGSLIIGAQDSSSQLELGGSKGTWTPAPTNLIVVGTPTYTGTYTKIGRRVFCELKVASTTSTASTANSTNFAGLPFPVTRPSNCSAVDATAVSRGNGLVYTDDRVYTPTWPATGTVFVTFSYDTTL